MGLVAMLENFTPFPAEVNAGMDHLGQEYLAVVVAAAFSAYPGEPVMIAEEPAVLRTSDEFYGAAGSSSVRYEADFAPEKPRVDVLLTGHARAPRGRSVERLLVVVQVGTWRKELLVTGDRSRQRLWSGAPRPFIEMPLVYERAYGGTSHAGLDCDLRNPVGVGYKDAAAADPVVKSQLPNIEYPDGRAEPAGFGVIARSWQPRLRLAGTYNADWLAERWPLLPTDFEVAHHQAAPPDQQMAVVRGGEVVELIHLTEQSPWRFTLPALEIPLRLWYADRGESTALRVDTLLIEPDLYRFTLTARAKIPIPRRRAPLRQAIIGDVSNGWWRARLTGKLYLDRRRMGLTLPPNPLKGGSA